MRLCQDCIERHRRAKNLVTTLDDIDPYPCDECKHAGSISVVITPWGDYAQLGKDNMTDHDWREFFLLLHRFIVALDDWICNKFKLSRKAKGKHK